MNQRLPFYMVYDTDNFALDKRLWDEDFVLRRDYDYMKSAYPETAKRIIPYVEAECDRLEYSGSMMFDEYPDQLQLRMMCRRIYDKAAPQETDAGKWFMDLIQVLTWHEIMKRRSEYRKYRRKYY